MSKLDPLPDYLVKHVEDYKEIYNMDKAYGTPKSLGTPSPIQQILWDLIISDRLASVDNPEITEVEAALLEYISKTLGSMIRDYDPTKPPEEQDFDSAWNTALWAALDVFGIER